MWHCHANPKNHHSRSCFLLSCGCCHDCSSTASVCPPCRCMVVAVDAGTASAWVTFGLGVVSEVLRTGTYAGAAYSACKSGGSEGGPSWELDCLPCDLHCPDVQCLAAAPVCYWNESAGPSATPGPGGSSAELLGFCALVIFAAGAVFGAWLVRWKC